MTCIKPHFVQQVSWCMHKQSKASVLTKIKIQHTVGTLCQTTLVDLSMHIHTHTYTHTCQHTHLSAAGQTPSAHQKPSPFAHVHGGTDDLQTETTGAKGQPQDPSAAGRSTSPPETKQTSSAVDRVHRLAPGALA